LNNKKTAPLSKKITFRINESEYEKFQMLFKNAKLNKKKYTTSDFIRNIIFENNPKFEVIKTKTIVRDKPCKDESLKIYHLNKIGNNINQIAYTLNTGKVDIHILKKLDNISELLKVMI
jgi:hypothetical protein